MKNKDLCILNNIPCKYLNELSPTYTNCSKSYIPLTFNYKKKLWIRNNYCMEKADDE